MSTSIAAISSTLLTLREVCATLRLSEKTVLNLINARSIPAIKTGRQWRIRSDDLDNYTRGETCPSIVAARPGITTSSSRVSDIGGRRAALKRVTPKSISNASAEILPWDHLTRSKSKR